MTLMSTPKTYGEFTSEIPASDEYLTLSFSPTAAPRKRRWGNYGLSADFLGDYFAAFFPGDELPDSKINRRDTVKGAVSYFANELLENAVKYSDDSIALPVSISLYLYDRHIIFRVVNYATQAIVERYQQFIETLIDSNLEDLYLHQLELAAIGETGSNMGVLTMIQDYGAKFGWQFQVIENNSSATQISVLVKLDV